MPGLRRDKVRPTGSHDCWIAKKLAQHTPSSDISAKKLAQHARKRRFWAIFPVLGELFRAYTMTTVPQGELFRAPLQERAMQGEKYRAQDSETWRR